MSSYQPGGRGRFKPRVTEYFGYVLDIFEDERVIKTYEVKGGRRVERRTLIRGRIGQVIGDQHFVLFEVLFTPDAKVDVMDKVYIGPGKPKANVEMIIQRIDYGDLTEMAKTRLEEVVKKIVVENEGRWVQFFNTAGPVTPKLHALELLPHIGKKKMWTIVKERDAKPFESFKDIEERTGIDPVKALCGRIMEELMNDEKYYLFVYKRREEKP